MLVVLLLLYIVVCSTYRREQCKLNTRGNHFSKPGLSCQQHACAFEKARRLTDLDEILIAFSDDTSFGVSSMLVF